MKTMSVDDFEARFSTLLKSVLNGEEIGLLYGKNKELVAKIVPVKENKKTARTIGILEGKGKVKFGRGFKITEEDFLN